MKFQGFATTFSQFPLLANLCPIAVILSLLLLPVSLGNSCFLWSFINCLSSLPDPCVSQPQLFPSHGSRMALKCALPCANEKVVRDASRAPCSPNLLINAA